MTGDRTDGQRTAIGRAWLLRRIRCTDRDRGTAVLELTGLISVVALMIVSVGLAVSPQVPVLGSRVREAICKVTSLADGGSCNFAVAPPEQHIPTQPCVLSTETGSGSIDISVVIVKAKDNRSYEVAKLSDGTYRVTLLDEGDVGVGVGVGGGVTVTVDDTKVGETASADVSASLGLQAGQTWYVKSEGDVQNLLNYQIENAVKDYTIGGGPLRGLVDWGESELGIGYHAPDPDETTVAGGLVLDASAEATSLVDSAGASVGSTTMLGVKTTKSGQTTVYLNTKVEGEAGLQALGVDTSGMPQFQGAGGEGSLQMVTAVTFDNDHNMTDVTTTVTEAGKTRGLATTLMGDGDPGLDNENAGAIVYTASLPIHSDADRNTALAYLAATGANQLGGPFLQAASLVPGMYATTDYLNAVRAHGYLTQQAYTAESSTPLAAHASGEVGIELGGGFEFKHGSTELDNAQYWDGTSWQKWEACG